MEEYKIFCDESNHLDYKDNPTLKSNIMVLGAIKAPSGQVESINKHIKYLKHKHNHQRELKWTKLISCQKAFYDELLDFFFSNIHLRFQAVLVPNKQILKHDTYNQNNTDIFYYKMYYYVLRNLIDIDTQIKIYLDYKDSRCGERMRELEKVLSNQYKNSINIKCYTAKSCESQLIQLTDILIGAISYKARDDIQHTSIIKNHIINKLEMLSNATLNIGTPPWESKFNIFRIELGRGK